jgi:hypothetical protein
MRREIKLSLAGTDLSLTAQLLDDVNREACDVLWRNVPYESVLLHTVVSGKNVHTFIPDVAPFFDHTPTLARRLATEPGTIFTPDPRCLFVKYGPDSEDHAFPPVARIAPGDLEMLDELGRRSWDSIYRSKALHRLRVTRVGDDCAPRTFAERLLDPGSFDDPQLGRLVADMNEEIARIWLEPPAELLDLHSGRHSARTGMGSYGQYLSTLFFAEGEVNRLSNIANIGAVDNLLRLCQRADVDVPLLQALTKGLCTTAVQYLRMCGQEPVSSFFLRAVDLFPALTSKVDYFRVFSTYALYTARLNGWHIHRFPWHHGDHHRYGASA